MGQTENVEKAPKTSWFDGVKAVGEPLGFCPNIKEYKANPDAYKGSVAINGVSLTINEVEDTPAGTRISINLIPHTFEHTAFKHTKKRDLVNVEVDTVARYIERMYSLTEHN